MWTCPICGRRLHVRNQEHACSRYDLSWHFEGKHALSPLVLEWVLAHCPDVEVLSLKTFIAFQARSNFASLRPMKKETELSLVLTFRPAHPLLRSETPYGGSKTIYRFRLESESDLDEALLQLLLEARKLR